MKGKSKCAAGMHYLSCLCLFLCLSWNPLTAQVLPIKEYTSDDGLPQAEYHKMIIDSRGYLWRPTKSGLVRFDGITFTTYTRRDGLPSNSIGTVFEDAGGTIWAVSKEGVSRFNGSGFRYYHVPDSLRLTSVNFIQQTEREGEFFLSSNYADGEKVTLLFDNGTYHKSSLTTPILNNADFLGNYYFTPGTLLQIVLNSSINLKWEYDILTQHITDSQGVLWLATESWIYRVVSDVFVEYDESSGLMAKPSAIFADPNKGLWIGSFDGYLQYFDGERFINRYDYRTAGNRLPAFYRGSTQISTGEVLISTDLGVFKWDGNKFSNSGLIREDVQVCIIYEDPADKTIFIGADKGLYHFTKDTVVLYTEMSSSVHGVTEGVVRDDNGNYWIASQKSIVFFDGERFTPFVSSSDPSAQCWGVIKDSRGNIWSVGSDGLYICDPDAPAFIPALPAEDNLPSNVIRDLGDGRLLIGRMSDLCLIDLDKYYSGKTDYYTILGRNQGYRGFGCQDNGIIKDRDGYWWILTSDKLIRFDTDRLRQNEHPPQTHITMIEYLNDSLRWTSVLDTALFYKTGNEVTLPRGINDVRISYTGISSGNPEGVTYQYRLISNRNNPLQTTRQRSVIFNDIRPGHYIFELHSSNADGVMTPQAEVLSFTVVPVLVRTRGAITLFSLAAVALSIIIAFTIRRTVLQKKVLAARQQAESYRLQLNSVIRQFDPHFTFNAVSSVGSLIMKGEKEKAYDYFIKLSGLLRSVLTESTSLLKPLSEEIEFVTRYCELQKLRFGDRFDYSISIDPAIDLSITAPKMIIQSFVENAVKHGLENKRGSGRVNIDITRSEKGTNITVNDNGIGRVASSELRTGGSGLGLKNLTSLIETINRFNTEKITFTLTDLYNGGEPAGTYVKIFLPDNFDYDFSLKEA